MKRGMGLFHMLLCLVLLAACSREEIDPDKLFQLYFINNAETKVEVHEYKMQAEGMQEQIEEMLLCLASSGTLEYKDLSRMGVSVRSYEVDNGAMVLDLSEEYKNLSPTQEILVRAAVVCSLTQIEGVNTVEIMVEGNPFYDNLNNLVGRMSADQFINNLGKEINTYEMADLTLYFANEAGDGLIEVNRKKAYNTNIPLERLVVEQLILGPGGDVAGQVFPTINPDTQIVSVRTRDGICYVNLNETFLTQIYNVSADVTIYSIVNSLAELSTVNKVQISINGDTSGTYREKYSFGTVFVRNLDIVTTLD